MLMRICASIVLPVLVAVGLCGCREGDRTGHYIDVALELTYWDGCRGAQTCRDGEHRLRQHPCRCSAAPAQPHQGARGLNRKLRRLIFLTHMFNIILILKL